MKTFKEFLLDKSRITSQTVYLPYGASVVNIKDTDMGLMLLVICDSISDITELRTFKICSNDENFSAEAVEYIGSFDSYLGTKHVVELKKGE